MATKKAPTRKQLAARRKFVALVRRRAKEARAAKRGTTKHRNVAMGYMAGGVFHPIRGSSDYSPLRAGEKPGGRTRLRKKPKSAGKPRGAALAAARVGAKRRASHKKGVRVAHNPVSVTKNGRKLYGAAAQAVLASRAGRKRTSTSTQRGVLLSGRKANPKRRANRGFWSGHIKKAVSARLHKPISFRRRNSGAPADIAAMHEKFLCGPSKDSFDITAPQGTPKDVAVLGSLVCLKTEDEDFDFEKGEAFLGADGRGNLYVLGDTTPVETNENFGHIEEIRYEARKDHLEANPFRWRRRKSRRNSSNVEYFHYFGEEDGVMPKLKSDSDGLLHISGGNYSITEAGIEN